MTEAMVAMTRAVGKGAARACRRQGLIPGILYGKGLEPIPLALDTRVARVLLSARPGSLHTLAVAGTSFRGEVMLQDVQRDSITGKVLHIDLRRVLLTEEVRVEVPVVVLGEEELERKGLVLQHQLHEIEVECLPKDIPAGIRVDVSQLKAGDAITAGQLSIPPGVRMLTPPSEIVAVVVTPVTATEEAAGQPAAGSPAPATQPAPAAKPQPKKEKT